MSFLASGFFFDGGFIFQVQVFNRVGAFGSGVVLDSGGNARIFLGEMHNAANRGTCKDVHVGGCQGGVKVQIVFSGVVVFFLH